ncbi:MAG: DeoR family transcriptional regulator [Clostridia bacterium]|nr:DeoR family transcriptional regulator [Clostridia bacterium]
MNFCRQTAGRQYSRKKCPRGSQSCTRSAKENRKKNELIRNADLCEGLGVSPATANRVLRELSGDGTLKRVRDGRFWVYRLAEKE